MTDDDPGSAVECRVGVRETLVGGGAVQRRLTIHCDFRLATVDMATCVSCERYLGVRPRADGRPGVVLCHRRDGDAPAPAHATLRTLVWEAMERDIVCVEADVRVEAIAALLLDWGARGIPVVDESGHPIGMISWPDVTRGPAEVAGVATQRSVRDVMVPLAFAVEEGVELSRAAAVMSGEGFHQLPVLLGDGSIVGLLSTCAVAERVVRVEVAPR